MRLLILLVSILTLIGCSTDEKPVEEIKQGAPERSELSMDSKIFLGNRLFSEKTCITCHGLEEENIGPTVVDIMRVYNEKDASIEEFLLGNSEPIVDTTASQVAIMQDNIDGFLKKVTAEELNAIATYMQHVSDSYSE